MKYLKLTFALFMLIGFTSCDKGKDCECTSSYSDGSAESVQVHQSLNKTSDPDCSGYEGTSEANDVTTTTNCLAVDA